MIKISNLTYKYDKTKKDSWALDNINLDINEGEYLCILGNNGSRKNYFCYALKWDYIARYRGRIHR